MKHREEYHWKSPQELKEERQAMLEHLAKHLENRENIEVEEKKYAKIRKNELEGKQYPRKRKGASL